MSQRRWSQFVLRFRWYSFERLCHKNAVNKQIPGNAFVIFIFYYDGNVSRFEWNFMQILRQIMKELRELFTYLAARRVLHRNSFMKYLIKQPK